MASHERSEGSKFNPGKNRHLVAPSEVDGKFFTGRKPDLNWNLTVRSLDGTQQTFLPGTDWEVSSRFGSVKSAVVTGPDGSPLFDRPRYDEAPNVNIVAYGKDKKTGQIKIGMISQARPHADNDFEPDSTDDMKFSQIPMGFLEKVIGKDQLESVAAGATRETTEETGATAVKNISYPEFPKHYPNPTFVGTNSDLAFVEVDLEQIDAMKIDRTEGIFQADYIPLDQLIKDIDAGKNDHGYTRMATANSALLIFLSGLSSMQNAEKNERRIQAESSANKEFKQTDPEGYVRHSIRRAVALHGASQDDPQAYREQLEKKGQIYLKKAELK